MLSQYPIINADKCVKCKLCIEVCPTNAIHIPAKSSCAKCVKYCVTMQVPCAPEKLIFDYDQCTACGNCLPACPEQAIYWFFPENK